MTAPPLPPCPVCGREPREWECSDVTAWAIACTAPLKNTADHHELHMTKPTRRAVRALWRRVAGGRK